MVSGRKAAFRAGFWQDSVRESTEIDPPAGRRPAGRPIRFFPGSSPAKIRPGMPIFGPEAPLRNMDYVKARARWDRYLAGLNLCEQGGYKCPRPETGSELNPGGLPPLRPPPGLGGCRPSNPRRWVWGAAAPQPGGTKNNMKYRPKASCEYHWTR